MIVPVLALALPHHRPAVVVGPREPAAGHHSSQSVARDLAPRLPGLYAFTAAGGASLSRRQERTWPRRRGQPSSVAGEFTAGFYNGDVVGAFGAARSGNQA